MMAAAIDFVVLINVLSPKNSIFLQLFSAEQSTDYAHKTSCTTLDWYEFLFQSEAETKFGLVLTGTDNWLLVGVLEPVNLTGEVKQSIERNQHNSTKKKKTFKTAFLLPKVILIVMYLYQINI